MFISMNHIRELFSSYTTILKSKKLSVCLTHYAHFNPSISHYDSHVLYVTDSMSALSQLPDDGLLHLLLCTDKQFDPDQTPDNISLLIVYPCALSTAEDLISSFYTLSCGRALMADSLLDILFSENGIQAMVDKVYPVFQNPIVVFDAGFHLIAANFNEIKNLPIAQKILENMGFSEAEFHLANQNSYIHKRAMKSSAPTRIHHKEIGYDQYICPINSEKAYGHIVLTASNHPFRDYDAEFLTTLQKAIDQQIKKEEFVRNNRGFQYEYLLKDILDGKVAITKAQASLLNYTSSEFGCTLYCMVVETAKSSNAFSTLHVRSDIESCFPESKTLLYNGEIVAILKMTSTSQMMKSDLQSLQEICEEHGLFAGLSNEFHSISDLPAFYTQALRAIEMGSCHANEPSLFVYRNYYQDHLFHLFTQKESARIFCHPQMLYLLNYDKNHDSELAKTLYMFLVNERNHSAAAKELFVHRNTFIYRMKKINDMLDIDYENYTERQYLILSYEMNHE